MTPFRADGEIKVMGRNSGAIIIHRIIDADPTTSLICVTLNVKSPVFIRSGALVPWAKDRRFRHGCFFIRLKLPITLGRPQQNLWGISP
jgi:hypothetical protein